MTLDRSHENVLIMKLGFTFINKLSTKLIANDLRSHTE